MKSKLKIIGVLAVFAFALVLNLQTAFDDYDVGENNYVSQAIAQSSSNYNGMDGYCGTCIRGGGVKIRCYSGGYYCEPVSCTSGHCY